LEHEINETFSKKNRIIQKKIYLCRFLINMKFGFYVSDNAGRLKLFLQHKFEIESIAFVLIDNTGNQDLVQICEQLEIPFYQYSYSDLGLKFKEQNRFISAKLLELMEMKDADYCFVFGNRILEGDLMTRYQNRLINFHPSLLPAFKGVKSIDQALENNALLLGNSAHFIVESVDSGSVIMQSILPALQFNGYDSVLNLQVPMLMQLIKWLKTDRIILNNGRVEVKNASYKIDTFIPNLEI